MIYSDTSEISANTIIEARDATYFENVFPYKTRIPGITDNTARSSHNVASMSNSLDETRRSKRVIIENDFGDDFLFNYLNVILYLFIMTCLL